MLLEMALISSGISCSRGTDDWLLLTVRAGVYSVTSSEDDSQLTLSASLPLAGYVKGESPLQRLLYNVGKAVPGVRWVITTENVHLVTERLFDATPEDDSLWVIGASCLLDQAIKEVDTQARLPEHGLWHFANLRSVAP
ncbi:MAG: hypothetical protein RL169_1604 [Armatimonadota bacterium]